MSLWLIIFLAGLITFATRLSFIYLLGHVEMPDWFRRSLRFVPVAVLSAITLPELADRNGAIQLSWHNPQLLAGLAAVLVAWRTKNVVLTLLAGVMVLLFLQIVVK